MEVADIEENPDCDSYNIIVIEKPNQDGVEIMIIYELGLGPNCGFIYEPYNGQRSGSNERRE